MNFKSLVLLIPAIRRLHEHRNFLLARVSELEKEQEANSTLRTELITNSQEDRKALFQYIETIVARHVEAATRPINDRIYSNNRLFNIWASLANLQIRDILEAQLVSTPIPALDWSFTAERQLAVDTNDHLFPRGTRNDNTRHPRFVRACEKIVGAGPLRHMDIGCAGGGLVWDFTRRGHLSVGLEGSDYSLREQRAEWSTIPDRLFTADICYPFHFVDSGGEKVSFDIISAWELFEHIPEDQLPGLLSNITGALRPKGLLAASIATFLDRDEATGVIYHHTVQPRDWWEEKFRSVGLIPVEDLFETSDFVRGSGNPTAYDWDARSNPELGFHIVLRYEP